MYTGPNQACCLADFARMNGVLKAPSRGTFRGIVRDVEVVELSSAGLPKRAFEVMDSRGNYIRFCAMSHNAESTSIKDDEDVVFCFGAGRGPIGTALGMVYLMKDAVIVSLGRATRPLKLQAEIRVEDM